MSEPKTYVPKCYAKEVKGDYGNFINLSFDVAELVKFAEQHKDEKGKLRLKVTPRKEVGQYGDTHSVLKDTWKPKQNGQRSEPAPRKSPIDDCDVPGNDSSPVPF